MNRTKIKERFTKGPDLQKAKKRSKRQALKINDALQITKEQQILGKNQTYFILTFGCQMNEHDTEVMAGILTDMGYKLASTIEMADVILLNTCAIRENAENKVFGKIGSLKNLKRENPDKIIGVCGCMSQEESVVNKLLTKYPYVDLIFGTHNIYRLPTLLENVKYDKAKVIEVWSQSGDIIEELPKNRNSKFKAWVNIIYGCDKFCTYCIVPYTRGKERSRHPEDIIFEVNQLVADGYQEVTLLGQNVNAYGKDLENTYTMANLLEDVAKTNIARIRFTTSHPWDFDDQMITIIGKYDNIMPHIHLPVQSGNNEILKIMGRSYTREKYLELFYKFKKNVPNATITTDIIVGYPKETPEQFEDTLKLYDECQFAAAYTFIYSAREGTPAAKMEDNVSLEEKKARLAKLNELVNKYSKEDNIRQINKVLKVLVEGPSKKDPNTLAGYSETMKLVHFQGSMDLIGQIVEVKILDAKKFNLVGELITKENKELSFDELLAAHREAVIKELDKINEIISHRAKKHDLDKLENSEIHDVYVKYFPELKKIKHGTKEYKDFEKKYFANAHQLHVQNRHHFYDHRCLVKDINLFDLLEAIVDINESVKQYDPNYQLEKTIATIKGKQITDLDLEKLIINTLTVLNNKK